MNPQKMFSLHHANETDEWELFQSRVTALLCVMEIGIVYAMSLYNDGNRHVCKGDT